MPARAVLDVELEQPARPPRVNATREHKTRALAHLPLALLRERAGGPGIHARTSTDQLTPSPQR